MAFETTPARQSDHSDKGVAWSGGVGATAGLGSALGCCFAPDGLVVALTGRNSDRLRTVADQITRSGGAAHALPGDLSDPRDVPCLYGKRLRTVAAQMAQAAGVDGLLSLDAVAESFWHLHRQHRSAWNHETDLRPYKESL